MTGESTDRAARHLRAVPDPRDAGVETVAADRGSDVPPQSVSWGTVTPVQMAAALNREAQLLRAVRGPSVARGTGWGAGAPTLEPAQGPGVPDRRAPQPIGSFQQVPANGSPHPSRPVVQVEAVQPVSATRPVRSARDPRPAELAEASLAERFEALATERPKEASELASVELDQALLRLRAADFEGPLLLPSSAMRTLAAADPSAAGELILGLLPTLHRVASDLRLDVDVDGEVHSLTVLDGRTVVETRTRRRRRRDRDMIVKGRSDRLASAVLGGGRRRVKGRAGLEVIRALTERPHAVAEMLEDGVVLSPGAVWSLVASATAGAVCSSSFTVVHSDTGPMSSEVTVTATPGRPLSVVRGVCRSADATVVTGPAQCLSWVAGESDPLQQEGKPDAVEGLRSLFRHACSPIRPRS